MMITNRDLLIPTLLLLVILMIVLELVALMAAAYGMGCPSVGCQRWQWGIGEDDNNQFRQMESCGRLSIRFGTHLVEGLQMDSLLSCEKAIQFLAGLLERIKAMYELTIKVCANELTDLEQLLCEIAEQILSGVITGGAGNRAGSYKFDLIECMEEHREAEMLRLAKLYSFTEEQVRQLIEAAQSFQSAGIGVGFHDLAHFITRPAWVDWKSLTDGMEEAGVALQRLARAQ